MGGIDRVAERGGTPQEHLLEAPTVQALDRIATGEVDERGDNVDEREQRRRDGTRRDLARPACEERNAQAGVIDRPLAVGPLGPLIRGVNEQGFVLVSVGLQRGKHFADALIHRGDVLVIVRQGLACLGRVDQDRRERQRRGIIGGIRLPDHVRAVVAQDEAERLVGLFAGVLRKESVNSPGVQPFRTIAAVPIGAEAASPAGSRR